MECVGAFARERFSSGLAARTRLGLGSLHLHQRKISDRPGPGEFGVVERGMVARGSGEPRERHDDKNEVPQGSSNQRTAGNALLNPAISEESSAQKTLGDT